jgi:hypothetical protein
MDDNQVVLDDMVFEWNTTIRPGAGSSKPGGGDGGDVIFKGGKKPLPVSDCPEPHDGDIIFQLAYGTESLRLVHDGSILVRGKLVETETEYIAAFKQWLAAATVTLPDEAKILCEGEQS